MEKGMSIFKGSEAKKCKTVFIHEELSEKEFLEIEEVRKYVSSLEEDETPLFFILISKEYGYDHNEEPKEVECHTLSSVFLSGATWVHHNYDIYVDENLKVPFLKIKAEGFKYYKVFKKLLLHKRIWRYL
jgi:hypothetical protein